MRLPVLDENPIVDERTVYTDEQETDVALQMGMPGVSCSNCPAAEKCPEFKPQHLCAYEQDFSGLTSRNPGNVLPRLELIADLHHQRAMRAVFLERRVAGGQLDPNVTRQLEISAEAALRVQRVKAPVMQTTKQTIGVTSQAPAVAKGPGLLQRLMAGLATGSTPSTADEIVLNPQMETITVTATSETHTPMEPSNANNETMAKV